MKRAGFTIIELVVAAGIIGLILAVSLPRYVAFSRQQDFGAGAQRLVQCMRQGQAAAASKSSSAQTARYVRVAVESVATSPSKTTCSLAYVSGFDANGVAISPSALTKPKSVFAPLGSAFSSYVMPSTKLTLVDGRSSLLGTNSSSMRKEIDKPTRNMSAAVFFDGSATGAPVGMCYDFDVTTYGQCDEGIANDRGLGIELNVAGLDTTLNGHVSIGPLGLPISYEHR